MEVKMLHHTEGFSWETPNHASDDTPFPSFGGLFPAGPGSGRRGPKENGEESLVPEVLAEGWGGGRQQAWRVSEASTAL